MPEPINTPSPRFVALSVSTFFTILLISGSVHSFQPAFASPSSHPRYNTNSNIPTNEISPYTTTYSHTNGYKENERRRRNIRLSASTTVPPSFHKQQQHEANPLFFREYDSEKSNSLARLQSKSVHSANITSPSKLQTTTTSTGNRKSAVSDRSNQQEGATISDARKAWERKYCSVAGLRESFGTNRNVIWGDFDASITRRLYKCLLPVALLELYETGHVPPQDLAPLAYRARVAAKLYARERSHVPARLAAAAFDGYRQWRKYGRFDSNGMSYDQVWNKYAAMIAQEKNSKSPKVSDHHQPLSIKEVTAADMDNDDDSVTAKICLKILERSCHSNEMIDRLVLKHQKGGKFKNDVMSRRQRRQDLLQLRQVSEQLERDVQLLLQQPDKLTDRDEDDGDRLGMISPVTLSQLEQTPQAQKFRALRAVAKVKRRIATLQAQTLASLSHHTILNKTSTSD